MRSSRNLTRGGECCDPASSTARVGCAEIDAASSELLTLVGLPGPRQQISVQLSGGQQQRVALAARSRLARPAALDEPLSALDARVRIGYATRSSSCSAAGVTTIMVTHDQEEALAMADRIVVMNEGVIE